MTICLPRRAPGETTSVLVLQPRDRNETMDDAKEKTLSPHGHAQSDWTQGGKPGSWYLQIKAITPFTWSTGIVVCYTAG